MTLQSIRLRGEKEKRREEEGREREREKVRDSAFDDDDAVVWGNLMKRRREGGFFRKGKERRGGEKNLKIIKREKRGREKRGTDTKPHSFYLSSSPIFCHSLPPLVIVSLY